MPKRGGGGKHYNNYNNDDYSGSGSRFAALKHHDADDYFGAQPHNRKDHKMTRRVSFKPSQLQTKGGIKGRLAEMALRSLEDDEDMDGFATTSKSDSRSRRKGSPIPRGKFGKNHKVVQPNAFGWYQVTIHNVQHFSKDEIVRALLSALNPDIIMPYHWRTESNCVIFFVNEFKIAERLQQVARNIQFPNGFRIFPHVRNGIPIVHVDDNLKMRITHAMVKRYNQQTRSLDLSKFYADADLRDTFIGLFRQPIMSAVLDILEHNLKDLEALNLNENNFSSLEAFRLLENRLPNLKILYLAKNRIPSLASLLVLRNVPLLEVMLKDNPLCSRYREHSLYVSEVRRKFPKLLKLDGEQLEKQILFDEFDAACSLPKPKASFLCDASGAETIRKFLELYFQVFDSNTRQPLLDAYHEHAQLSMSIPPATQAGRLETFWRFNRNFRRVVANEDGYRQRQLKVGRLQVVTTLQEWPGTKHDMSSFCVDLTLSTPQMIVFSVDGLFKELDCEKGRNDIRYFHRQFIIVPAGSGFCIRNDTVTITNATPSQQRAFLKPATVDLAAATSAMASTSLQSRLDMMQPGQHAAIQIPQNMLQPGLAAAQPLQVDEATKLQMVQALTAQTNMNLEWSKKCLEDTNWDYNHAINSFNALHKENRIPPEAFIK